MISISVLNHLPLFFTGGDCAEDINEHLRPHLEKVEGLSVCSADTILRGVKELATPDNEYISSSGISHTFNINFPLNQLLVKMLKHTGQINSEEGYTLDYDNQVIATEKYDAKHLLNKEKVISREWSVSESTSFISKVAMATVRQSTSKMRP